MHLPLLLILSSSLVSSSWFGLGGANGGCPAAGSTCSCSIPCASYLGMSGGFGPGGGGGGGFGGAGAYPTGGRGGGAYATAPFRSKRERILAQKEDAVETRYEDEVEEETLTGTNPFRSRAHGSKITREAELEGFSEDHLCNSPTLKKILKANIVDNADQSRNLIQKALRLESKHDFVVICTPNPFGFTATRDTEYCSVSSIVHSCYVFAF
ncbi:hypothetical protein PRIPAC_82604 [Pristionchus pacificus]|uniref:Ground-like domain-containing protein n=1 Tax=Pristionchus pacificus TaxID=54126 RepID=A0A454XUL8_PRIPA|nr:hypothetical protein PRIPAC_82604 [Pristionchus pacificus]|eukprot:PDM72312.1 hypothetical protein PRIPAC_38746 [Pristionchus pacificus]